MTEGLHMSLKVEEIRRVLRAAAPAYDAFCRAAIPGVTETALESAMLAAAGGLPAKYDLLSGPRTADIEGGATARVLTAGDALILDLSLKAGGHWCDVCRTFFLGAPDVEMTHTYEKALGCHDMLVGLLRPDVPARSLYAAVESYFEANGLTGMLKHHTGHGIGEAPFIPPVELKDSEDIIREGDVMTVEIGAYRDGRYGVRLEDDYLVTAQGAVPLWDYPIGLQSAILTRA